MKPGHCHRAFRAALFAALCVLLAATGHLLMSGAAAPWWALCAATAAASVAGWFLSARERGPLRVTVAAVAVQGGLHAVFSLAQALVQPVLPAGTPLARQWAEYLTCGAGSAAPSPGGAGAHAASHVHHALHDAAGPVYAPMGGRAGAVGHEMAAMSPAGMLTAHLLAAVLCGLWLAHGERAAFRIARCVAAWLRTPLRLLLRTAAPSYRPPVLVRRRHRFRAPRRLFLVHVITSRGPPAGTAVL
ncbi:hypothetical protein ABZZ17_07690 [Streptomyces sp. NPDC006512]|uniref:hypothetical protein n=1 Tax=Streptomyces sp. NPDC006512 TaxID=3154307 RepID=UPI0033A8A73D